MSRKWIIVILFFLVFLLFYLNGNIIAQTDNSELMEQGKIRTCLVPTFVGDIPHGGGANPIRSTTYELKGSCESPTGCYCVWNQGKNTATAQMEEMGECSEYSGVEKGTNCKDPSLSERESNRCTHCGHINQDAKNGVLSSLQPVVDKQCNIIENKLNSGVTGLLPQGPIDIIIKEDTARHTNSDFSAVGDAPVVMTGRGEAPTGIEGKAKSQQLAEAKFLLNQIESNSEDLETSCTTISWDPYGRVFDAVSLEPIADVEVTLVDALTNKPAVQQYNWNNDVTGDDGVFNIQVEKEGSYQMTTDPVTSHVFKSSPKLSPNWSKIYSDLYYPGINFIEKINVATHHDIPLQPISAPYREAVAKIINGTLKSQNLGNFIVYTGRATFPMAKICLRETNTGKIVGKCVNANNIGKFTIAVEKNNIPEEKLQIVANKVDLNNPDLYKKDKKVETLNTSSIIVFDPDEKKSYYFEPILSHVEGYVYDGQGVKIPGADVLVKLKINNKIFYQTRADDSGFFTIYTNKLPYIEYYLEFVNPQNKEKTMKTTSEFIAINMTYLDSEKINLMQGTKYGQEIINPSTGKLNKIVENLKPSQDANKTPKVSFKKAFNLAVFVIQLIIVFLSIVVVGLIFYIKKHEFRK